RPIKITAAGGTLGSSSSTGVTTYNGTITGPGTLAIGGSGTTNAGGSSAATYTGPLNLSSGALSKASHANACSGGAIYLNGGNLRTTGNITTSRLAFQNTSSVISVAPSTTLTMTGVISGAGATLTKGDAGNLTLTAANLLSSSITVAGGGLIFS